MCSVIRRLSYLHLLGQVDVNGGLHRDACVPCVARGISGEHVGGRAALALESQAAHALAPARGGGAGTKG